LDVEEEEAGEPALSGRIEIARERRAKLRGEALEEHAERERREAGERAGAAARELAQREAELEPARRRPRRGAERARSAPRAAGGARQAQNGPANQARAAMPGARHRHTATKSTTAGAHASAVTGRAMESAGAGASAKSCAGRSARSRPRSGRQDARPAAVASP